MIQLAFFAPGHGIYWLIGVLIVFIIYKWKTVLMGLLYLLLLPLMFPSHYLGFLQMGAEIHQEMGKEC